MKFRRENQSDWPIFFNVTSLVDILLVLVIFLLATWAQGRIESEVGIELPASTTAPQQSTLRSPVVVNINTSGGIMVNKRSLDDAGLRELLDKVVKLDSGQTVVLRADKGVSYERMLQVLDLCKEANVASVGFGALPPKVAP